MAKDVGTVKWVNGEWNAWINEHFTRSTGIGEICDWVAAHHPAKDLTWTAEGGKLTVRASTETRKLSKSDN